MQTNLENERVSAAVLNVRFDDEEKELQSRIKVSKGWKAIARKAAAAVMAEQKAKDDALAKLASETEAAKQGAEDSKKAEVRAAAPRAGRTPPAPRGAQAALAERDSSAASQRGARCRQDEREAARARIAAAEAMRRKAEVWAAKEHEELKAAQVCRCPPPFSCAIKQAARGPSSTQPQQSDPVHTRRAGSRACCIIVVGKIRSKSE
jgi:hypothetical protein